LINHLIPKNNVARTLHDLIPGVIPDRQHGAQHTARNATVIDAQILRSVEGAAAVVVVVPRRWNRRRPLLPPRRHRWNSPVRWIYDERCWPRWPSPLAPMSRRSGAGGWSPCDLSRSHELLGLCLSL